MPKRHQQRPAKESAGHNNPEKSTEITTGTSKKHATREKQAAEHQNPDKLPQDAKVHPSIDTSEGRSKQAESRLMEEQGEQRSGSDSNAHKHRKGSSLHENHRDENRPQPQQPEDDDFDADLRPENLAGENHGLQGEVPAYGLTAEDIKGLHTTLADLTDDELRNIVILPVGARLEQGAKYIDLQHLEQGEFVATASMMSDDQHYYVPKKETDYVLWNRLNQVTNPARLDETE